MDFKRVTVFIGPTGRGKSTLAKLAAVFRQQLVINKPIDTSNLHNYGLYSYWGEDSKVVWNNTKGYHDSSKSRGSLLFPSEAIDNYISSYQKGFVIWLDKNIPSQEEDLINNLDKETFNTLVESVAKIDKSISVDKIINGLVILFNKETRNTISVSEVYYTPSERIFIAAIEYSWAGLMRDDIGLPKALLDFANSFSTSRKNVSELHIPFFNVIYQHIDGRDFIKIPEREEPLMLLETASGIQSVTPMMVLLEHLSRQKEQAQSFIIEEPELNLYPTAQQGLMNWLVEKCTVGENDLTITTHSPYILSHLNLLLYAYQVAEKHPDRKEEVAAIVPEASWIDPKEFACYQVENGGVQSLVNEELGLIDDNGLDNLSGDAADAFDNLIRLSKSVAVK
ncbi:AAA domain-containing protein, putative AbiEii toxin, Type IV TA system [Hymenobacter actinosclerus]|uniref:AAA domain-containing protein, putative AbiEii toxin, Type IV TA system n=1 Tax=Hymenobacter actinosclerus TaxID=82805 RepID=A0A1H9ZNW2_9BACT|nr:AAA domain-containing protein, putative AbiEii toxin, Type IV TA system [Hymenobacter actinosclerus]